MKIFKKMKDGGPLSRVTGYWLIEWKRFFSIAILRFDDGSREAYHTHAFNAWSWVLWGKLTEDRLVVDWGHLKSIVSTFRPSLKPFFTSRDNMHKVSSEGRTWAITFRGPWADTWQEYLPEERRFVTLTHGRKEVDGAAGR